LITVDDPAISMTIGTNTSPLVGRRSRGKGADAQAAVTDRQVTARQVKDPLDRELIGPVALRVLDTDRPDPRDALARADLALALLIVTIRGQALDPAVVPPQV
ncbi:hypothetical protein UK12_35125, partial [Saccharothrix sp. ST-888]